LKPGIYEITILGNTFEYNSKNSKLREISTKRNNSINIIIKKIFQILEIKFGMLQGV
jgi:hypothetical protein